MSNEKHRRRRRPSPADNHDAPDATCADVEALIERFNFPLEPYGPSTYTALEGDVSDLLPRISVPTVVVHYPDYPLAPMEGARAGDGMIGMGGDGLPPRAGGMLVEPAELVLGGLIGGADAGI